MHDRAMQTLYALALAPVAETGADPNSYGFREGRRCADALEHIHIVLSRKHSPQWVLEGDSHIPHPRADSNGRPLVAVRRGVPTPKRTGWRGLSRMKGNFHVRFLEGSGLATARSYSV
jgi:hypothetical protein